MTPDQTIFYFSLDAQQINTTTRLSKMCLLSAPATHIFSYILAAKQRDHVARWFGVVNALCYRLWSGSSTNSASWRHSLHDAETRCWSVQMLHFKKPFTANSLKWNTVSRQWILRPPDNLVLRPHGTNGRSTCRDVRKSNTGLGIPWTEALSANRAARLAMVEFFFFNSSDRRWAKQFTAAITETPRRQTEGRGRMAFDFLEGWHHDSSDVQVPDISCYLQKVTARPRLTSPRCLISALFRLVQQPDENHFVTSRRAPSVLTNGNAFRLRGSTPLKQAITKMVSLAATLRNK